MGFIATSKKFYDAFTGTGGGGIEYLDARIGDKITAVVEGYFYWAAEGVSVTYNNVGKTITLNDPNYSGNFIALGFKVGDTINSAGTASNNTNLTITAVTSRVITVAEALVNEDAPSATITGTSLITAMEYFYNAIENGEQISYASKTDKGTIQKYIASGLDAAVATPVYAFVGSSSYAWVTEIVTGDESELFIEGMGIVDYKQKFRITHSFYFSPVWNLSLFQNYAARRAPDYFLNGKHLKYVCQVDGKFDANSPVADHSGGSTTPGGTSAWLNQNAIGNQAEYKLIGITYEDDDTAEAYPKLVANKNVLVTITLQSRSGRFTTNTSKFILKHFLTPQNEKNFVGTETTMLQNLRHDEVTITMGAAPADGINMGNDYQVITDAEATFVSNTIAVITFVVKYSDLTLEFLKTQPDTDRYYAFICSCQNEAVITTKNSDRVNVLCDYQTSSFDLTNAALLEAVDFIHCFPFPNTIANEKNSIHGYQGDLVITKTGFRIDTTEVDGVIPTLEKVSIQIVSTKEGEDDFIIEEKIFNTNSVRKLDGISSLNIQDSRGFTLADGSEWNVVSLTRDASNDSGAMKAFMLQYGFALRFEEWIEVVQAQLGASYDIFKNVPDVVQAWKRYCGQYGWDLKYRIVWAVNGYDAHVTEYQMETDIVVLDATDEPEEGEVFTTTIKYFSNIGDKFEIAGLVKDGTVRIVADFMGDPTVFPADANMIWGSLFASNNPAGSVFNRRLACTEFDSEEDSPFSTVGLPASGAISERQSANLRISIYADRVRLDTFYTDVSDNKGPQLENIFLSPRIGYTPALGIGAMAIGQNFIIS